MQGLCDAESNRRGACRRTEVKAPAVPMQSAQELVDVIASVYRDKPDDYVVSVCHWRDELVPHGFNGFVNLPRAYADIKLTAGELRALATKSTT